ALVFGPRTAYRTPTGRVHEDGQPGPLRELVGHRLLNFDGMRPGIDVRAGGHRVEIWAESYEPEAGECVVAYDDGPLAGQAAVVKNGPVYSVGAWSQSLVTELLRTVLQQSGVPTVSLPEGVRVSHRGNAEIWMNFNQEEMDLPDGTRLSPVSFRIRQ
ncbi:MAG: beta-galactosidase trimerization domain-containing protein, partial [Thermomicrobiales bacterium]